MSDCYIDDGYTCTKTIPAAPGFHGELTVVYRPALYADRRAYVAKFAAAQGDPKRAEQIARDEFDAVAKHVASLNGEPVTKDKAARLKPVILDHLVNLIFSYAPADESADAKN